MTVPNPVNSSIAFLLVKQVPSSENDSFHTEMREFSLFSPSTPLTKKLTLEKIEKWTKLTNLAFLETDLDESLVDDEGNVKALSDLEDGGTYFVTGDRADFMTHANQGYDETQKQSSIMPEQPRVHKRPITQEERELFSVLTNEVRNHSIEFYFDLEGCNFNRAVLNYLDLDLRDAFVKEKYRGRYRDGLFNKLKRSTTSVPYDGPIFEEPLTSEQLLNAQLIDAAFTDDFNRFQKLYNFRDTSGQFPTLKIDRKVRDSANRHILHYASSVRMAKYIVDQDPSLFDIIDNDGFTPLAHAIVRNRLDLAQFYLEHYFSKPPTVPLSDHAPVALLLLAVQQASPELNLLLVHMGHCDPSKIMEDNMSPFYYACMLQRDEVVRALLDNCGPEAVGLNTPMRVNKLSPLTIQILKRNTEMAKYFVEKGAFIDYVDSLNRTIFYYVVVHRNDNLGVFLVEKGIQPVVEFNGEKLSPEELLLRGLPRTAEVLERRDGEAMTDIPQDEQMEDNTAQEAETPKTPLQLLFHAIEALNFDTVRSMCVNNPSLVNEPSPLDLQTSLHVAVESESYDVVKFLLEHSAFTGAANYVGSTPAHIAQRLKCAKIISLLKTKRASFATQDLTGSSVMNSHNLSVNSWICTLSEIDYDESDEKSSYRMPGTGIRLNADIEYLNESHLLRRKDFVERVMQLNRALPSVLSAEGFECCRTLRVINVSAGCICAFYQQENHVSYHDFVDYFISKTGVTSPIKDELRLEKKLELMSKLTLLMSTLHRAKISHGNVCSSTVKVARTSAGNQEIVLINYNLFGSHKSQAEEVHDFGRLVFHAFFGQEWNEDLDAVQSSQEGRELVTIVDSCLNANPDLRPDFLSLYNQVSKARYTLYQSRIEKYQSLSPQIAKTRDVSSLKALQLLIAKEETGMDEAKSQQIFMDHSLRQFDFFRIFTSVITFGQWSVDPAKVFARIESGVIQKNALSLDTDEHAEFSRLKAYISAGYKGNAIPLDNKHRIYSLLSKMLLNVPVDEKFPLLDVLRVMICDEEIVHDLLTTETAILNSVFSEQICTSWCSQKVPYKLMALRVACNLCKWSDGLNWWYGKLKMLLRIINESWQEEKAPVRLAAAALSFNLSLTFPDDLRFTKAFCKVMWACLTKETAKLDTNSKEQKESVERCAMAMHTVLRRNGAAREESKKLPNTVSVFKILSKMDVEYSLVKSLAACMLKEKDFMSFS
eukprot:CAMPEP_0117439432 /NCGR_PEP_ID=MMETSP0759-20121206/2562_1 /TAXON_ID=63605 /ORGANISM="Percolomonas cosmopolitus, Strain WS" /LENGTH=1216 /DNA_ID=CAMNT_0005231147 /DNA_START=76 /DNA_END=3723 /DNA_ORIENTATION=-